MPDFDGLDRPVGPLSPSRPSRRPERRRRPAAPDPRQQRRRSQPEPDDKGQPHIDEYVGGRDLAGSAPVSRRDSPPFP